MGRRGRQSGHKSARTRSADMSLPPDQRGRQRRGKGRGTKGVVAQMDHGNNPEAAEGRRTFEKREGRTRLRRSDT